MKEKKNIDRLFQEQFKEFEANPPEHVWENISAELKKDKKRRVIPIWFKLSGVAAVFVIGLLLVNFFGNEDDFNQNSIVNDNSTTTEGTDTTNTIANDNVLPIPAMDDAVVSNDDETNSSAIENENTDATSPENNTGNSGSTILSNEEVRANNQNPENRNFGNTSINNQNNAVVSNSKTKSNNNALKNKEGNQSSNTTREITNANTAVASSGKEENYLSNRDKAGNSVIKQKDNNFINRNTENNNSIAEINSATDSNSNKENNNPNTQQKEVEILDKTPYAIKSASDNAIASEEINSEVVIDSASIIVPENELEKLLQEKLNGKDGDEEEELLAESDNLKWNIRPQMAPVFYNSLSQGSPIDSQFASNSKSYDNNMSYGVGIDYNITDRLAIRSGVNAVNLSYETRGVEFYPAMTKPAVASRNIGENSNLVVQSEASITSSPGPDDFASTTSIQSFKGSMVQEMGYIEVPVELSYALLNKKFGIDVIGGVSTLFLNNNDVRVVTEQGYSSNLGEAKNINNVNFSTNIGIGFKYKFLKSFKASFEPMFKYQVNTFSENSGNFKPYFIGLYSGISFSF